MIERPRRRMTLYERRRMSKSPYIKYDKSSKLWIQHRKVVYLYWFKFLQHAERGEFNVNWRKYRKWGGRSGVMESKFDDWWKDHWKPLFSFPEGQPEKSPFHTKKKPEISAMRTALLIYENQHRGSLWDVGCWVRDNEIRKGREPAKALVDAEKDLFTTPTEEQKKYEGIGRDRERPRRRIKVQAQGGSSYGVPERESWVSMSPTKRDPVHGDTSKLYWEWEGKQIDLNINRQTKRRVQGYISRYLKQANELMTNISEGSLDPS